MAKKHLAAVSLLIVLIFGLTSCVCRSSDTAISMPVYDKPASATANTRTMQDETVTKSSSEKSSEATTESAQSEDASALIFPNPCSEQFDLSERDAVLFDAAVAARNRTPNADICIPEIGVYGTYEEAEKTVIVCHVCYHFYYGCDGTEHYTDSGAMQAPAKAVLEVSDDMLLRETHCAIKKVSEFVQNRAGLENVNPLLCVCRRADAIHAELAAESCEVLRADHERPAIFVESVEDRLGDFAEFQQECVHIPLYQIFHCDRCIGRRDGQVLRQDGMKKLCGFSACDEFRCSLVLSTKPKLLADAQGVFTGRKPVKTVERRVIERDSGCREYSPIEFTAADKAVFVPNRSRV